MELHIFEIYPNFDASMQVREAYGKWWKTKQSQSEFLSKLFPTKRSTLAVSVSQVEHSMLSSHSLCCYRDLEHKR